MITNSQSEITTLDEAYVEHSNSDRPVKVFTGINTGRKTLTMVLSLFDLKEFTDVANELSKNSDGEITQRNLIPNHATDIARYILKGLISALEIKRINHGEEITDTFNKIKANVGTQSYLSIPPIVACLRDCKPNGTNLRTIAMKTWGDEIACYRIFLGHGDKLWIVDGQHRRKAVQMIYDFLDFILEFHKYPKKPSLYSGNQEGEITPEELSIWNGCKEISKKCNITVEVHLGLTPDQERQLFFDLNNYGKGVEIGLASEFDQSNPLNLFIKDLIKKKFMERFNVSASDNKSWQDQAPGIIKKDLVAVNAVLFLNKTNINGAIPALVDPRKEIADKFWDLVLNIPGMTEQGSKTKTVAAQPVVMKAIAKLVFDYCFGKNPTYRTEENAMKLFSGIPQIDFSHSNKMWNYYAYTPALREQYNLTGLSAYLPDEKEGFNRDIGAYDGTGYFRFGAKHNDIFPIIGDMIRWQLELPARKKAVEQSTLKLELN